MHEGRHRHFTVATVRAESMGGERCLARRAGHGELSPRRLGLLGRVGSGPVRPDGSIERLEPLAPDAVPQVGLRPLVAMTSPNEPFIIDPNVPEGPSKCFTIGESQAASLQRACFPQHTSKSLGRDERPVTTSRAIYSVWIAQCSRIFSTILRTAERRTMVFKIFGCD